MKLAPRPTSTPSLDPASAGRMEVDDRTYSPGDLVKVRWPDEDARGIAYSLDAWTGSGWSNALLHQRGEPRIRCQRRSRHWWEADTEGGGWVDIGILGPGPDVAIVPNAAEHGTYRLCTANSPEQSCVLLKVK